MVEEDGVTVNSRPDVDDDALTHIDNVRSVSEAAPQSAATATQLTAAQPCIRYRDGQNGSLAHHESFRRLTVRCFGAENRSEDRQCRVNRRSHIPPA
jgi:hypothetical protein